MVMLLKVKVIFADTGNNKIDAANYIHEKY